MSTYWMLKHFKICMFELCVLPLFLYLLEMIMVLHIMNKKMITNIESENYHTNLM